MSKVNAAFPHDLFRFLHKPLRDQDVETDHFVERFVHGPQRQLEDFYVKMDKLLELLSPEKTPFPRLLKDHVGFTKELDNVTRDISDDDLRKLISLAIPLWREKGLELGYKDIVKVFTGKSVRIFNWFDFRFILGEQAIGEEQLGEDAWFISEPGVYGLEPQAGVVLTLPFDGNTRDLSGNDIQVFEHGAFRYQPGGAQAGSVRHAIFTGGVVITPAGPIPGNYLTVPGHAALDWSGDLTVELFAKSTLTQDAVLVRQALGLAELEISWAPGTNTVGFSLSDGVTTVADTVVPSTDLDGGGWVHLALVVDRTTGFARLWVNGVDSTAAVALGALGDLTMAAEIFVGASAHNSDLYAGALDELRLSAAAQYDVSGATIPVPGAAFGVHQTEQLDEFKTDIRVVDRGDLNRTLTKRILNLMRPMSERLNVIYIDFFEDFLTGKGDLVTVGSPAAVVADGVLSLPDGAVEEAETAESATWQDYVLQTRFQLTEPGKYGVRFLVTDLQNYYQLVFDSVAGSASLERVVAGVTTVLVAATPIAFYDDVFYIATVMTDLNDAGTATLIKCYQDSNLLFEVSDGSFIQGTWAVAAFDGGAAEVSDLEMFTLPLDVEFVTPGFNL